MNRDEDDREPEDLCEAAGHPPYRTHGDSAEFWYCRCGEACYAAEDVQP